MAAMENELEQLRQALANEQRLRKESDRQREEADRRREEADRRREEADRQLEEAEQATKPLSLHGYLEASHSLSLAIDVVTDYYLTTKGDTTNPAGRVYPRRIVPWDEFPTQQEKIWALLAGESLDAQHFPSQHQVDYFQTVLKPISCEQELRHFERRTVEDPVQKLVGAVYDSLELRGRLRLRGPVTFESHTNLGPPSDSDAVEAPPTASRVPRRTKTGRGTADQFCIRRTEDGADVPVLAIEYKAPHKLGQEEVATGLQGEIQPARDIINQDGEGFAFAAKSLTAAVITQLFSYMIGKGIQYGYVCTGQVFVFLHVPDDPTVALYHVCVPNEDVMDDDEDRLHRTAVAQVFAFVLQSLRVSPPTLAWQDAAANLDTWDVEYDDILRRIPTSVRKEKENHTPYKAQRWRGFSRSRIRTRAYCNPMTASRHRDDDDDDDDEDMDDEHNPPSTPTPTQLTRRQTAGSSSNTGQEQQRGRGGQKIKRTQISIQDRPYCTQACLSGLARGGPVDTTCPNAAQHGAGHIAQAQFLRLLRDQLARDRGSDADATPLYLTGSVGSLFKVRLSAFGYTLVAKGVITENISFLQGEKDVYDALAAIQGQHIPVCLGLIDLILPHYCDGGVYRHFLLLAFAGKSLNRCFNQVDEAVAISAITAAYKQIHQLRVLHNDAYPRNILFDAVSGHLMVTDFERSTICRRDTLGPASPNSQRKRKREPSSKHEKDENTKHGKDENTKELELAVCLAQKLYKSR